MNAAFLLVFGTVRHLSHQFDEKSWDSLERVCQFLNAPDACHCFPLFFAAILLFFASHTHAGSIMVSGTGVSCPAIYPASFADIPGATGAHSLTLFEQTDVCVSLGTFLSIKRACSSNSTVSQIYYSDASCTKFQYQLLLGSANTCISSPGGGVSFFSCDSPTALPPFVLKDGGVLLGGLPLNHSSGPLASASLFYNYVNLFSSLCVFLEIATGHLPYLSAFADAWFVFRILFDLQTHSMPGQFSISDVFSRWRRFFVATCSRRLPTVVWATRFVSRLGWHGTSHDLHSRRRDYFGHPAQGTFVQRAWIPGLRVGTCLSNLQPAVDRALERCNCRYCNWCFGRVLDRRILCVEVL
jgi:hypothetical protein